VNGLAGLLLDATWALSKAPTWLGWACITGGLCAGSWLLGAKAVGRR